MGIRVEEKTLEEIEAKINEMQTDLNKIAYLESALKEDLTYEVKRFIWEMLAELYESQKMYEKAAKAIQNRTGVDISFKEKVEGYLHAGELYAKAGKVDDAESMFLKAFGNADNQQKLRIKLAMKNIFLISAQELERKRKELAALKYYERLIKMPLDEIEKKEIKDKLITLYRRLGRFKDAKLVEGI